MASTANKPKDPKKNEFRSDPNAPQYRALQRHYIDGKRINVGETVVYDGIPGRYLEPLNAAAKKAKASARKDAIARKEEKAAGIEREVDEEVVDAAAAEAARIAAEEAEKKEADKKAGDKK